MDWKPKSNANLPTRSTPIPKESYTAASVISPQMTTSPLSFKPPHTAPRASNSKFAITTFDTYTKTAASLEYGTSSSAFLKKRALHKLNFQNGRLQGKSKERCRTACLSPLPHLLGVIVSDGNTSLTSPCSLTHPPQNSKPVSTPTFFPVGDRAHLA